MPLISKKGHGVASPTEIAGIFEAWVSLKAEQGCLINNDVRVAGKEIERLIKKVKRKNPSPEVLKRQPDGINKIRELRPKGPRILKLGLSTKQLEDRMLGALLGRAAGCVLGIPCEGMSKKDIKNAAIALGERYPLKDYWTLDPCPSISDKVHYNTTPRKCFLKPNMCGQTGADDDLVYTILGLLIIENYGLDFTSEQVGEAWLKYLPHACTAERIALENLKKGIKPPKTALVNNPLAQWIGADIRSDPWGYVAAGMPNLAAELAWRDARISHVMNGIYGEMFFSAVISAAFAVDDVEEMIRIGLSEIPRESDLGAGIRKTLAWAKKDNDWGKTVERILKYYKDMSWVHTINNAAITVAGLMYGGGNFEKTITLTVMGGLDTDCTAATAGSVIGAMKGAVELPNKWTKPLGSSVLTYLKVQKPQYLWSDLAKRFTRQALLTRKQYGLGGKFC